MQQHNYTTDDCKTQRCVCWAAPALQGTHHYFQPLLLSESPQRHYISCRLEPQMKWWKSKRRGSERAQVLARRQTKLALSERLQRKLKLGIKQLLFEVEQNNFTWQRQQLSGSSRKWLCLLESSSWSVLLLDCANATTVCSQVRQTVRQTVLVGLLHS